MSMTSSSWEPSVEGLSGSELAALSFERLKATLRYAYEKSPFYRRRFRDLGGDARNLSAPEDLELIPFTSKEDLRNNASSEVFAVPESDLVRVHMSSGTTGAPIVVGYTQRDIQTWSNLMARSLSAYGMTRNDIVQVAYGYGLFTGGLGFHYGAERVGAMVIPTSTGMTTRQIEIMQRARTTVLCCTPSYALYIGEKITQMGMDPRRDLSLRFGAFGAEPWSEGTRKRIEEYLGLVAYDHYGLTEMSGPGVAAECQERNGLHVWTDHFYPEVVDPKTGESLESGERGELVLTTLSREATPLVRFRTGDITSLETGRCECGRSFPRITRIHGRTDDMLKVKGTIVYPRQIEEVILDLPDVGNAWEMVVERKVGRMDSLTLRAEAASANVDIPSLRKELVEKLRQKLFLRVKVEILEVGDLPRFEGKARRVIDLREL